MDSNQIKSLHDLLEKLRLGKIEGTVEIRITTKGKVSTVFVKSKENTHEHPEAEITHRIIELQQERPELKADFSHLEVQADAPGLDFHESNFSYTRLLESNLPYAHFNGAPFYKAIISQSNISHASGLNMDGAYLTGSVNLYNAHSMIPDIVNPLDAHFHAHEHGGMY